MQPAVQQGERPRRGDFGDVNRHARRRLARAHIDGARHARQARYRHVQHRERGLKLAERRLYAQLLIRDREPVGAGLRGRVPDL